MNNKLWALPVGLVCLLAWWVWLTHDAIKGSPGPLPEIASESIHIRKSWVHGDWTSRTPVTGQCLQDNGTGIVSDTGATCGVGAVSRGIQDNPSDAVAEQKDGERR